jgi:hypothetical protein
MIFLLAPVLVSADTTVSPTLKFSWGPNYGWMNWQGDITNGVVFDNTDTLSGYIWSPNCGWINLGDGSPAGGTHYANNSAGDYGVNITGEDGNCYYLTGYGWSPNIGWINFNADGDFTARFGAETSPTINKSTGVMGGYVWSPNCGWLPLNSGGSNRVDINGGDFATESTGWMLR